MEITPFVRTSVNAHRPVPIDVRIPPYTGGAVVWLFKTKVADEKTWFERIKREFSAWERIDVTQIGRTESWCFYRIEMSQLAVRVDAACQCLDSRKRSQITQTDKFEVVKDITRSVRCQTDFAGVKRCNRGVQVGVKKIEKLDSFTTMEIKVIKKGERNTRQYGLILVIWLLYAFTIIY